ncbi:putative surface antigen protein 2 [Leptomonas pyrrhocoris]|uniref:Putative surface antigen protein 2 n=1 Tax=Leptomonas pyrrhocoris TaxID=157538 RepID=A0A0M9FTS2_LEPPY|nr:putative surface antigen protein 2 [Leptomonas pyrrhocoris]KPA75797.1 putative surface antigen protein 2 [Leptomonas pyrrhocoris]|eukprot:XP_015654236.1 putative surface antigen protein 2 [Leptomonas pyrrhocoris]
MGRSFAATPQPWKALAIGALLLCCVLGPHLAIAADSGAETSSSGNPPVPPGDTTTLTFLQALVTAMEGLPQPTPFDDYCKWEGIVTCNDDGTVSVKLTDSASKLTKLSSLPELAVKLDGTKVAMKSFEANAMGHLFGGALPASWGKLTQLQTLSLSGNTKLTSSLPSAWSGMTALTQLVLSNNGMSGSLPPEWSGMTALAQLVLTGNKFCGCVLATWSAALKPTVDPAVSAKTCATANACDKVSSSSASPFYCDVVHCTQCAAGNDTKCIRCDSGYTLTDGFQCISEGDAAYWQSLVNPSGLLMLALLCASVLWNLI